MPGEIRDGKYLVAQRRHKQQVHLREDARHFHSNLAAKTVTLHEINCGEKARLAEGVWPCVGYLRLKLIDLPTQREFFERGCRLGEEDHIERIVGPVRN